MKLRVCKTCKKYTLKELCPACGQKTAEAHYKFRERYAKEHK